MDKMQWIEQANEREKVKGNSYENLLDEWMDWVPGYAL